MNLIFRTSHNTDCVMRNAMSDEVGESERNGGAKCEGVQHLVAGAVDVRSLRMETR